MFLLLQMPLDFHRCHLVRVIQVIRFDYYLSINFITTKSFKSFLRISRSVLKQWTYMQGNESGLHSRVLTLLQHNDFKQREAWLFPRWMIGGQSYPCTHLTYLVIGGGFKITFKPLVPKLGFGESSLILRHTLLIK